MKSKLFLLLLFFTGFSMQVSASHIMGGSLTYKDSVRVGSKKYYRVTLKMYRDDYNSTVKLPGAVPIGRYSVDPGFPNSLTMVDSFYLNRKDSSFIQLIPPSSKCNYQPSNARVQEVIYERLILLDTTSQGFYLIYENSARNAAITNLTPGQGIGFSAYIPGTSTKNSTPYFVKPPVSFFCQNTTISFFNTAIDPDGDSLAYNFVIPYAGNNPSPNWNPPFGYSLPIPGVNYAGGGYGPSTIFGPSGNSTINPSTGVASFTCSVTGFYVVAIEVSEYRKGVLLSRIRRDLQIIVDGNCPFNPPPKLDTTKPGVNDTLYVDEGGSACFPLDFVDPNGDSLFVIYSGQALDTNQVKPAAKITGPTRSKGSLHNTICWNTKCGMGRTAPYTFRAIIQDDSCPSFPIPIDFYIYVRKPAPVITGVTDLCIKDTKTYSVSGQSGSSFKWYITKGTPPTSVNTTENITWNTSGNGTITVIETNQYNCKSDSIPVNINVRALPVASVTGNLTICNRDTVYLTGNGGTSYQWSGGIVSTTKTVKVFPNTNTTYTLVVNDGYCNSDPFNASMQVNPNPVITTTYTDNKCPFTPITIQAGGGSVYKWFYPGNPVPFGTVASVSVAPSVTSVYQVSVTDNNSCTSSMNVTINVLPFCVVSINPSIQNDTICFKDSLLLNGSGNASTYYWTYKLPTDTAFKGTGYWFNTQKEGVTAGNTVKMILHGIDNNQCKGNDTINIHVRALPLVKISTAKDSVCPGESTTLKGSGAKTYAWYDIKNQGSVLQTGNSYTVMPLVSTTYLLKGQDSTLQTCAGFDTLQVYVRKLPVVNAFAIKDSICTGKSVTLSGVGGKTYEWSILTNPGTVVSTSKNYLVSPTNTTSYILKGTDKYSCNNQDTIKITVLPLPTINATASPDSVCPGTSTMLKAKGAVDYLWKDILTGTYIGTDSLFSFSPVKNATYVITGSDKYQCANTDTLSIFMLNKPQPRRIIGPPYVCPDLRNIIVKLTDTIPGFPAWMSTYQWSFKNSQASTGQPLNLDSIYVDFSATPGMAYITVIEKNIEGCFGDTMTIPIKINSIFNPPSPLGSGIVCSRDSAQIYTSIYNTPGSKYVWHIGGGVLTQNDSTYKMGVKWDPLAGNPHKIWYEELSKTATANCYGLSDTLKVYVYPTPKTSTIIGRNVVCAGDKNKIYSVLPRQGSTFTWIAKGGKVLSGDGSNSVLVRWDSLGNNKVKVLETSDKGCPGDTIYLNVLVKDLPVIEDLEGPMVICSSNKISQKYYVRNGNPQSTYLWNITSGKIVGNQNKDTVYITWDNELNGSIQITVNEITPDSCTSVSYNKMLQADNSSSLLESVGINPLSDHEAFLEWDQSSTKPGFNRIYRKLSGAPDSAWMLIDSTLASHYTDKTVNGDRNIYEYRFSAYDKCGNMSLTAAHNTILLSGDISSSQQSIDLSWNAYKNFNKGLMYYELWRKVDNEGSYTLTENPGSNLKFNYTGIYDGFRQCFRVRAIENGSKNYSWSNDTCFNFEHLINIPTAFSPNGDGVNDKWVIRNIEAYRNSEVEVFNRWGEKVFSAKPYKNDWDGKDLPDGTYFYVLRLNKIDHPGKDGFSGNITIVR